MYSMRYMHRYDKDTTACTSKKQNYDGGTPADFFDCFSLLIKNFGRDFGKALFGRVNKIA